MVCLNFKSEVIQGHQRSNKVVNFFRATFFAKHSIYYTLIYTFTNQNTYQHKECVIMHHSAKFHGCSFIHKIRVDILSVEFMQNILISRDFRTIFSIQMFAVTLKIMLNP